MLESASSDLSRCFIALLPPLAVQTYAITVIQTLKQRYRTRTAYAPPHITLQAPFLWPLAHLPALEAQLSRFTQSHSPIPIHLLGFGAFAPRVIYINVVQSAELMAQQAALKTLLKAELDICDPQPRPFVPHLTVASRHFTRQTFRQAWADLQTEAVEFEFVVYHLTLLIYQNQQWQVQTEFPLRCTH
jgi:2'-5' RNA ligase